MDYIIRGHPKVGLSCIQGGKDGEVYCAASPWAVTVNNTSNDGVFSVP